MAASSFLVTSLRSQWQSFWHDLRRHPRRPAQPATLGIRHLPEGMGQLPVGTPALLLAQDEASARQWAPMIITELLACGPVLLLAARAQDVDALWHHVPLRHAYDAGRLRVALFPPSAQARLRRDGLMRWAEELRRSGLKAGASLCLLDARALLSGASMIELRRLGTQLHRFAFSQSWPVVLMLPLAHAMNDAASAEGAQLAATARAGMLGMSHIATLAREPHGSVLTLHSWDSAQGAVFHMRYALQEDVGGLAYAGTCSQGEVPTLIQAPDIDLVYATQACLPPSFEPPENWTIVPTREELEQAARHAVGATALLDAGEPQQFDALGALVHRLRSNCPPSLKIIVRETTGKLRAHSEQALLHLGATTVAYRELGFARLMRLIEANRQVVHAQPPAQDLECTLAAFRPAPMRGYLAPAAFERAVRAVHERRGMVQLTHTLVYLQLLPRVAHLDALQSCRVLRDGDLVSADASGIWVFLFACSAPDVPQALSHMFTLALEQLFSAQVIDSTESGIAAILQRLRAQAPGLPDHGGELTAAIASTAVPRPATPEPPPMTAPILKTARAEDHEPPGAPRVHARPIARRDLQVAP
ncbi:MAG: cellulose biosynthesis protein BcsE [Comamonas sp.]|nr:cellulose biosynthesis protein BcsE [Comamonas sp.]